MSRNDFESNYLAHHGILGQKWGIRRYQYEDGTLTEAGRKRYGVEGSRSAKQLQNRLNDYELAVAKNKRTVRRLATTSRLGEASDKIYKKRVSDGEKEINNLLKQAKESGYSIDSKPLRKIVNDNQDRMQNILFALVPYWSIPLSIGNAISKRTFLRDQYEQTYNKHTVTDPNEKTAKEKFAEANQRARERTSIDAAIEKGLAEYNAAKKEARDYDKKTKWDEWDEQKSDDLHRKAAEKNPTTNKNSEYRKAIKDRVEYAKNTGKFDMEFLERNLDLDPVTEKQMKGEKLAKAYEKFLLEEYEKKHK